MKNKKMKSGKWLIMIRTLVAALFVLSLFSGMAAADTHRENIDSGRERYQEAKDRYKIARENFQDAKDRYQEARDNFNANRDEHSREELISKTKEFLEKSIDNMIAHLEVMKERVEDSDEKPFDVKTNIDEHITVLERIKTDVQNAETAEELRTAQQEIKDQWVNIQLETRYYVGILINNKIDRLLTKTDTVSERMDSVIQKLKDNGEDTSKLEDYAADFNENVNDVKIKHNEILDLYSTHDGFDSNGMVSNTEDARSFLEDANGKQIETHKEVKKAITDLRNFFKEAKKLHGGKKVVVSGTGTLEASGNGKASIEGDLTVTLSGGDVTLTVSNNAEVTPVGNGTKEELSIGDVKYNGYGSATVTGDNIRLEISGNDIELTATGTGTATLSGHGTYKITEDFRVSGEWDKEE